MSTTATVTLQSDSTTSSALELSTLPSRVLGDEGATVEAPDPDLKGNSKSPSLDGGVTGLEGLPGHGGLSRTSTRVVPVSDQSTFGGGTEGADTEPGAGEPVPSGGSDSEPPDGGWEAWRAVACCSMVGFWFTGLMYSWGVMQAPLVDRGFAPAAKLAFVGSVAVAPLGALAILNSRILLAIGARSMAFGGIALMSVAQITASFATHSVPAMFLTAGVMMGLGVSASFMVISVTPAQYFTTKRGTALGIVYAAGGLGGAVLSLALEAGVRNVGVEWTFRITGIAMAVSGFPACWFLKERSVLTKKQLFDVSLFKSLDFLLLFTSGALATFPLFVPPFFLPMYAQSLKLGATTGAILVCIFNFSSAVGRILTGFMSDRLLGPINTLCILLAVTALTLLTLWPTSTTLAELIVFVLLNGASSGGFFAIMPTVVGAVFGMHRMGVALGMVVTGWTGGYLLGAPIAGYILAASGGSELGLKAYRPAVFWAGGMALLSALLVIGLRWRKSPHFRIKM